MTDVNATEAARKRKAKSRRTAPDVQLVRRFLAELTPLEELRLKQARQSRSEARAPLLARLF